ncbi:hypothetical protein ES707_07544 [subsurface metagenome]
MTTNPNRSDGSVGRLPETAKRSRAASKPGCQRRYWNRVRANQIVLLGGECTAQNCHETKDLEFAHRVPNGVNGRGRGRQERYQDVRNNPGNYMLLCPNHHHQYDCGIYVEGTE